MNRPHTMKLKHQVTLLVFVLFVSLKTHAVKSEDNISPLASAKELEQAFAILDALLPSKSKALMSFYIPLINGKDFPQNFIDRLSENHLRLITFERKKSLSSDEYGHLVFDGQTYGCEVLNIESIHQSDEASAETRTSISWADGMVNHHILLNHSSGAWVIKKDEKWIYD